MQAMSSLPCAMKTGALAPLAFSHRSAPDTSAPSGASVAITVFRHVAAERPGETPSWRQIPYSVTSTFASEAGLDSLGECFEVADALNFIVGEFDAEMIFQAGEHFEGLQAVDAELFVEIVVGRKGSRGDFELHGSELKDLLRGLFDGAHAHSIYHPPAGKENGTTGKRRFQHRGHGGLRRTQREYAGGGGYKRIRPLRMPMETASAREAAPSLPRMEATWNFAVCSEIFSFAAISLLPRPEASRRSTSLSRGVRGSGNSSAVAVRPPAARIRQ